MDPIESKELRARETVRADGNPPDATVADLAVVELSEGSEAELVREAGVVRLRVRAPGDGVRVSPAPRVVDHITLGREALAEFRGITELDGTRVRYADLRFVPDPERTAAPSRLRRGDDRPLNVFGDDDRRLFADTSFPWRTTGRVWTAAGSAAGCTIGSRLVLTASHCIDWDDGEGGIGWVKFSPGYDGGNGPWGEYFATRVISWNRAVGGLSDLETAFDYVVLVMDEPVGDAVGWPGYRAYDAAWNGGTFWQHIGYPGDLAGGQRPSFQGDCVIATADGQSLDGQSGLVLGHFNDTAPGQSGGPVWGWWADEEWPRVVGVCSAEASRPAPDTSGDNEFGGGPALSALIAFARTHHP